MSELAPDGCSFGFASRPERAGAGLACGRGPLVTAVLVATGARLGSVLAFPDALSLAEALSAACGGCFATGDEGDVTDGPSLFFFSAMSAVEASFWEVADFTFPPRLRLADRCFSSVSMRERVTLVSCMMSSMSTGIAEAPLVVSTMSKSSEKEANSSG